ncbi:MAG: helix-turn-helix domain-containing protein [Bacteroidetes bacterium]|nr:helix-turn-helix domain-containing protein [Bacteroidota bacterium]
MYAAKEKTLIPTYSLAESSATGHELIEIREVKAGNGHPKPFLFLPHRKDYWFFFIPTRGHNRHWIDFVSYDIRPHALYFTTPNQVHLKERLEPVEGLLVAFTEEFLLPDNKDLIRLPILQNPDDRHEIKLSPEEETFLLSHMQQMLHEYSQEQGWQQPMLQSYLHIFLLYLSRLYNRRFPMEPAPGNGRLMVRRMKELLETQYAQLHQVSDYARLLNVSPGHLNDTIKDHTGKTAITLIHERILLEAKRTLFHAELSVKEIGAQLGFEDAAYFNRFFKRMTGETPLQFRQSIREKYH